MILPDVDATARKVLALPPADQLVLAGEMLRAGVDLGAVRNVALVALNEIERLLLAAPESKGGKVIDYDIAQQMIRYGGSFVGALGEAVIRADSDNLRRLREAFPEYWEEYSEFSPSKVGK